MSANVIRPPSLNITQDLSDGGGLNIDTSCDSLINSKKDDQEDKLILENGNVLDCYEKTSSEADSYDIAGNERSQVNNDCVDHEQTSEVYSNQEDDDDACECAGEHLSADGGPNTNTCIVRDYDLVTLEAVGFDSYVCSDDEHLLDELDSDFGDWETGNVSEEDTCPDCVADSQVESLPVKSEMDDDDELLALDGEPTVVTVSQPTAPSILYPLTEPSSQSPLPPDPPAYTPSCHVAYDGPPPSYEESSTEKFHPSDVMAEGIVTPSAPINCISDEHLPNNTPSAPVFHVDSFFVEDENTDCSKDKKHENDDVKLPDDEMTVVESEESVNDKCAEISYINVTDRWTSTVNPNENLRMPTIQPNAPPPPNNILPIAHPSFLTQPQQPPFNSPSVPSRMPLSHQRYLSNHGTFSGSQTWNPYPVVPPTMAPRNASPAFNVGAGSHGSCVNNGGGSSNGAGSLCSLPDPYERLKPETKKFVDNITNMGFMRARVSRTVEKLGEDDKKVEVALCSTV